MMRLIDADRYIAENAIDDWLYDVSVARFNILTPTVKAIPEVVYNKRLKADLEAILVELQMEIEELDLKDSVPDYQKGADETREYIADLLQKKIDKLKGQENEQS